MYRGSSIRSRSSIMSTSTSSSILNRSIFEKFEANAPRKILRTYYDDWAGLYDWDMLDMGYRLHDVAATLLMENMASSKRFDCVVLDAGCGTGFIGAALRKREFNGILHGVDENQLMLNIANRKNAYDDLYLQYLCIDDKIDVSEKLYDGLACIASFGVEHIHPKMLPLFAEHVKPGGVLVFSAANHPRDETDKRLLEDQIEKLLEENSIREVSLTREYYFSQGRTSREDGKAASCQLYCYIKIPDKTKSQRTKL
ncbi:uncharacterized protein LOC144420921 [Styela clava]